MRRLLGLTVMLVLGSIVPGSAQILGTGIIPVTEVGPVGINAEITAIESTVTAVQAVLQTGYQLLDITPFDDLVLSGEFLETMTLLGDIASEGTALMQDAEAAAADFDAIFGVEVLPDTPGALQQKVNETMALLYEARRYAVRTQSLIRHITGAVTHVTRIIELVGILSGNMQGNQLLVQLQAQANQTLATQTLQQAADQRIRTIEGAQRTIIVQGWNKMQQDRWIGWPSADGGE